MAERDIEYGHHPEVVEGGKGLRRVELLGLSETLVSSETRRAFFASLSDDRYQKMLGYINSLTRKEQLSYDFQDGQAPFLSTPALEDKAPLMQQAFQAARNILATNQLDSKTALRRAGLTMAGALNYIHPYEDGNGRTGRVTHYLIEYGTERGDQAFNDELYAIIAKLPIYETHKRRAFVDSLPPELQRALDGIVRDRNPDTWGSLDERRGAAERVRVFLEMMQGRVNVPINEDTPRARNDLLIGQPPTTSVQPAGAIDGLTLYEQDYLEASAVPAYSPEEVPEGTARIKARRREHRPDLFVHLSLDVLDDSQSSAKHVDCGHETRRPRTRNMVRHDSTGHVQST